MEIKNYETSKSILKIEFDKLNLSEFSLSEKLYYETLMDGMAFSKVRVLKNFPLFHDILEELSKSENQTAKFVYTLCSTIVFAIQENIPIQELRIDLYSMLNKIDLSKLLSEFLITNRLENPNHASVICNLIKSLQTTNFKLTETKPEKILKKKIIQSFRIENVGYFPLPMISYSSLFRDFDDLLVQENENRDINEIKGLIICFEKVNKEVFEKFYDLSETLAKMYPSHRVKVQIAATQFAVEALNLNTEKKSSFIMDLREVQINLNLADAYKCQVNRLLNNIDL